MDLATFGVEAWLNQYEASAQYDLAQSSVAAFSLDEIFLHASDHPESFCKGTKRLVLDYGHIEGSDHFKDLVAQRYQKQGRQNIIQTNGATGANLNALMALIEKGDHVLSMTPSYQQLFDLPESLGAQVDLLSLKYEDGWKFPMEELKQKIRPNTKLISINNANNPTGSYIFREEMLEIIDIARSVDAYILVDEVYHPLINDSELPSIVDLYDKGIATDSMSKTFALPGIRVGWIVGPEDFIDKIRNFRDYTMISAGVLNDYLATYALEHAEALLARNRKIIVRNRTIVDKWLDNEPLISWQAPYYVPTSFIQLAIEVDDRTFCEDLLKETGVLLVPGSAFGYPGYARLGYGCQTDVLVQGLRLLSQFLKQYQ